MRYTGRVTDPEALGLMLQQARLLSGKSQRQMAEELGVSQRYVWEMEAGKPSLYTERLFAMMRALGVELTASIPAEEADEHG